MTRINKACYERGCACYDDRVDDDAVEVILAQPEQEQEQEPVAWLSTDSIGERYLCFDKPLDNDPVQPLFTSPPQRKPLTDKAITQVIDSMPKKMKGFGVDWDLYEFARAIEAKPKENT